MLNAVTGQLIYPLDAIYTYYVDFSPNGQYIATGKPTVEPPEFPDLSRIRLWNSSTGQLLRSIVTSPWYLYGLEFSPDGQFLLIGGQNGLELWRMPNGQMERRLPSASAWDFFSDGKILTMSDIRFENHHVSLLRFSDGLRLAAIKGDYEWGIVSIQNSPDGRYIALGHYDGTLSLIKNPLFVQPGDTNSDECVNDFDLANVIYDFGGPPSGEYSATDLTGANNRPDGKVDDFDLSLVIFNFGHGCL